MNNSTNHTIMNHSTLTYMELFEYYYTPTLVIFGMIGNCMSVFVIFSTKLKKLCSSYYLASLAIVDTIFLCMLFMVWLKMNRIDIFNQNIMCQGMVYVSSVSSCLSVSLVMAFSIERFIAVVYPLESKYLCTVSRVKSVIFVLVAASLVLYYPLILMSDVSYQPQRNQTICGVKKGWSRSASIFNIVDTVITCVLPMIVIPVMNSCIIKNITSVSGVKKQMASQLELTRALTDSVVVKRSKDHSYKMTKMLLIVSTVCLTVDLPSYVLRILLYLKEMNVIEIANIHVFIIAQHISMMLFNTNFGVNFALYCASGQNFRKAVRSAFSSRKNDTSGDHENASQSTEQSSWKRKTILQLSERKSII